MDSRDPRRSLMHRLMSDTSKGVEVASRLDFETGGALLRDYVNLNHNIKLLEDHSQLKKYSYQVTLNFFVPEEYIELAESKIRASMEPKKIEELHWGGYCLHDYMSFRKNADVRNDMIHELASRGFAKHRDEKGYTVLHDLASKFDADYYVAARILLDSDLLLSSKIPINEVSVQRQFQPAWGI